MGHLPFGAYVQRAYNHFSCPPAARACSCRVHSARLACWVGPARRTSPSGPRPSISSVRPSRSSPTRSGSTTFPPGGRGEAHLPAQQPAAVEAPRLSPPDVDARRACHPEGSPCQGSRPAVGLIWSIRDRAVFDRFRTEGRRVRHGPLSCTWIVDEDAVPPRVAYALGRNVGSAVVRNRLRRRLRAQFEARARAGTLRPGWYLIGATPNAAGLDGATLTTTFSQLMAKIDAGPTS
jgi:ribonuclease P protein component